MGPKGNTHNYNSCCALGTIYVPDCLLVALHTLSLTPPPQIPGDLNYQYF